MIIRIIAGTFIEHLLFAGHCGRQGPVSNPDMLATLVQLYLVTLQRHHRPQVVSLMLKAHDTEPDLTAISTSLRNAMSIASLEFPRQAPGR